MSILSRHDLSLDVDAARKEATLVVHVGGGWTATHTLALRAIPIRPVGVVAYRYRGRRRHKVDPSVIRDGALSWQVRKWAGAMIAEYMAPEREARLAFAQDAFAWQIDAEADELERSRQAGTLTDRQVDAARGRTLALEAGIANAKIIVQEDSYMPTSRAGRPPTITAASILKATARAKRALKTGQQLTDQKIADAHAPPVHRTHLHRRRAQLRLRREIK